MNDTLLVAVGGIPEFTWGSVLIGASFGLGTLVAAARAVRQGEGIWFAGVFLWGAFWSAFALGFGWLLICIIAAFAGGAFERRRGLWPKHLASIRTRLARTPGAVVLSGWVMLFLGSFGVAELVHWAEYRNTRVDQAQRRVEQLERWERRPTENPSASYTPDWRRLLAEQDPYALAVESAFAAKGNPGLAALARAFVEDPIERGIALKATRKHFEREAQAQRQIFLSALGAGFTWLLAFAFVTVSTIRWVTGRWSAG